MSGRHIALLVEDEPEIAKDLGELLESIGHGHVHVTNAADARRLIEKGEFCYVLLDLQILAHADSIKPHVEAGLNVLEFTREKYPRRDSCHDKWHLMPVLVVSGHAKEHHYVVEAFHGGADDFITKPVSESKPPFKDKIQDALRRAGREKHDCCREVTLLARTAGAQLAPADGVDGRLSMTITGRQEEQRTVITIADRAVPLTASSFFLMMNLVAGRTRDEAGWVHKRDLGARTEQGYKGISRLKDEVRGHLPKKAEFVENNKSGSYRLNPAVSISEVDFRALEAHWDARVAKLAVEIRKGLHRLPGTSATRSNANRPQPVADEKSARAV
jgi:CheY-like chemotaxis protein